MTDQTNNTGDTALTDEQLEKLTAPASTATDTGASDTATQQTPTAPTNTAITDVKEDAPAITEVPAEPAVTAAPTAPVMETAPAAPVTLTPQPPVTNVIRSTTEDGLKKTVVVADESPSGMLKAVIDKAAQKASTVGKLALFQVGDYMENMRPRRMVTIAEGSRYQVTLYRALTRIINDLEDPADFNHVFTTVLKLFDDHKEGVFHEAYAFRFFEHVALSMEDRKAFQRLLNLLKIVAPVRGRAIALKQVDFNKSMQFGVSDAGRQRLMNYFNIQ